MHRASSMALGCLLLTGLFAPIAAYADGDNVGQSQVEGVLEEAKTCVGISGRLERLACFDQVFDTPLMKMPETTFKVMKPEAWLRATASESQRDEDNRSGFVLRYINDQEPKAGMWMTATALPDRGQKIADMPILMFSCIDNISRVELVLQTVTSAGKAEVTTSANYGVTQRWLSDDTGSIMRAGRGLPAIDVMKALMSGPRAVVRSDLDEIGNLTFDTAELEQTIGPMRQTCRW
ncbi:type VI secretion system-associated protein VasI [Enterovibrio sp. 27052020O]|uniref:type VI secretion system-associated protein VasI n=1 Tax=Enterovibrio sp. 27052020O TaxID=3241166 RepID=UPI00388E3C17